MASMKNTDILKGKTVLVTGGAGSFGKSFVKYLLANTAAKKVIVFSRDELKQYHMSRELQDARLRFFLGDVRDLPRLQRAFSGVDIVVHAAALKQVPALEYNPMEAVKTNIVGSQNVVEAAIDCGVSHALLISTDKAAYPANLYGSTKLCAEKLFVSGNALSNGKTKFSAVRYGNVLGSRGSIVETLLQNRGKTVHITDPNMTRFWINLEQATALVMFALREMEGGEIFIPKIPSMKLIDLVNAIAPGAEKKIIGMRPGEKIHEVLLTAEEAAHTVDLGDYYVVLPESEFLPREAYAKYARAGKAMKHEFLLTSDRNTKWMTKKELQALMGEATEV